MTYFGRIAGSVSSQRMKRAFRSCSNMTYIPCTLQSMLITSVIVVYYFLSLNSAAEANLQHSVCEDVY